MAQRCARGGERDRQRKAQLALNRTKFVTGPTLTLKFRHMSVQFNPTTLLPLGGEGTVDPMIHVFDEWETIDARNGALLRADWSALVMTAPRDDRAEGHLEGRDQRRPVDARAPGGWRLVPDSASGGFVLAAPH